MPPLRSEVILEDAERVLRTNNRPHRDGDFSVPTKMLYPYRWYWDSALIALGWAAIDEKRAWQELHASISGQWPDGMVPHIDFHDKESDPPDAYFPGAHRWDSPYGRTSGITQPTLTPQIALEIYKKHADGSPGQQQAKLELETLWAGMMNAQRWLYDVRSAKDAEGKDTGLLLCTHPWETGMDNSPAWQEAMDRIVVGDLPDYTRRDIKYDPVTKQPLNADQRPTKEFYDRAFRLMLDAKAHRYDKRAATEASQFAVADVGFNSLAVQASAALLEIGRELGKDPKELKQIEGWLTKGQAGLATMWHEELGTFVSQDWRAEGGPKPIPIATSAGFMPLLTDVPDARQVSKLANLANTWLMNAQSMGDGPGFLLSSIDPAHPKFNARKYWEGPVWLNVNRFVANGFEKHGIHHLSNVLRTGIVDLVANAGNREYFHPNTGEGLGGYDFGWTAAIILGGLPRELVIEVADRPPATESVQLDGWNGPELARHSLN